MDEYVCNIIDDDIETVIPAEVGWDGSQAYSLHVACGHGVDHL